MTKGNSTIIISIIVLLLILAGAALFTKQAEAPENGADEIESTTNVETDDTNPAADDSGSLVEDGTTTDNGIVTVTYTQNGFSPKEVTISPGDTVRFENESGPDMWVASALHPTHTVYPGSDIKKCGTADEDTIFDACQNYEAGSNWDFTFTETGEWGYHNHSRPNHFGKVIVASE